METQEGLSLMTRTYDELSQLKTFDERFQYLKLDGVIGEDLFGYMRQLNQAFYTSSLWKNVRNQIIIRDDGCDLGIPGHTIFGKLLVHHLNPLTKEDLINHSSRLVDPNNLITVSFDTHQAITYGDVALIQRDPIERSENDTCPWKGGTC